MKKELIFLSFILFANLCSALIETSDGGSSFGGVAENTTQVYNFSVSGFDGSNYTTITKVEATINGNFSYITSSNGASLGNSFSISGNKLTWDSISIVNGSVGYFWFSVLSSNISKNYDLAVKSYNSSGVFEQEDLSMEILDTIAPNITVISPESKTYNSEFVLVNVSINEKGICYYSSDKDSKNVSMNSFKSTIFTNNVSFANGKVQLTVYCSDLSDNWASESLGFRTIFTEVPINKTVVNTTNMSNVVINKTVENKTEEVIPVMNNSLEKGTSINASEQGVLEEHSMIVKGVVVIVMILIGFILIAFILNRARTARYKQGYQIEQLELPKEMPTA